MDDKKIQGKRRRCDYCGYLRYDVISQINPYEQDVHGEQNMQGLCPTCVQILLDGI